VVRGKDEGKIAEARAAIAAMLAGMGAFDRPL
jgi:hypothetical protein